MKKLIMKGMLAVCLCMAFSTNANAQLGNFLKNMFGGNNSTSTATESTASNAISGLTSLFQNLIGTKTLSNSTLEGTWAYQSPAVVFESSNLLNQAGGTLITNKMETTLQKYLSKVGFKEGQVTLTFDGDSTFQMKIGSKTVEGTYQVSGSDLTLSRKSVLLKSRPVTGNVAVKSNNLQITFKADKLLEFFTNVTSMTTNSTLNLVSKLAGSYDGMQLGFQYTKEQ